MAVGAGDLSRNGYNTWFEIAIDQECTVFMGVYYRKQNGREMTVGFC